PERRPARGLRAEQTLHPQCLRRRASEELADRRAKASQDRDQAHAQGPLPSSRSSRSGHDQGRGTGDQAGELTARLACCKVGLDGPLIPTAVVANLFRLARVSRPRRSADRRSPGDAPTVGDWGICGRRGRRVRRPLPEPATGRDCSSSTTWVNRRGPPSMSRAEVVTALLARSESTCYEKLRFPVPTDIWRAWFSSQVNI